MRACLATEQAPNSEECQVHRQHAHGNLDEDAREYCQKCKITLSIAKCH